MNWDKLLSERRQRPHSRKTNDLRTEFQKDYHRIIGSASFRRLQDKTQVFPLDKSDFVRTRLTHSLEVSSLAKSLGQTAFTNIQQYKDKSLPNETINKIISILECAGLIHDIGNPPFGHFGEQAIRDWFKNNLDKIKFEDKIISKILDDQMKNDLYNFEGNAQALRLITKLHFLVDENGMNLTFALLNTLIKYPVSSIEINKGSGNVKDKKLGYYFAEKKIFNDIVNETAAINCRYPLTYILEAADDIAYKTADIEDAVKKGCISYHTLITELKSDKYISKCKSEEEKQEYNSKIEDLESKYEIAVKNKVVNSELNAVQNWVISVQGFFIYCASFSFSNNYNDIMSGDFGSELLKKSYANTLAYALGDIAYKYAFCSSSILKLEISAGTIIDFLLDKFVNAAINFDTNNELSSLDKKLMSIISENYKQIYKIYTKDKDESEKLYLRLLLVTDYICGMTDSYAKRLYQELNGIN